MPKIIDHDERRREIVATARQLIMEGGFEAVTMRSIAAAAGFANGGLKHYFPDKASIISATFQTTLDETAERMADLDPALTPREALRTVIAAGMPLDEHRIVSGRVLLALWEHSGTHPELAEQYRQMLDLWRTVLGERRAAVRGAGGRVSDRPDTAFADEIIAVTIGAHVTSLMYPLGHLIERYEEYVDDVVERAAG